MSSLQVRVEWDFRAADAADALEDVTGHGLRLRPGSGTLPGRHAGSGLRFDGRGDVLAIPAAAVGPLDLARRGDTVTVAALVRRRSRATGFVAGMWQEDDCDPRRQYGLFLSLPAYGGNQQVCGHVSADGRPSPGLPYSRDYAATAREVPVGAWSVVAFSYDGTDVTAYLDGVADRRPGYREPEPPLGAGLTYAKNPYRYPLGLNRGATSDFTVGAVRLTRGMGNHLAGDVARLLVCSASLEEAAHRALAREWSA